MSGKRIVKFSKIHVENWRNFTRVDVPLQQRMFLVGPNASGKSNLLDIFRFLRDLVRVGGGLEKAVDDRGGVSRLRSLAARRNPDIVIDVQIENGDGTDWDGDLIPLEAISFSKYLMHQRESRSPVYAASRMRSELQYPSLRNLLNTKITVVFPI